MNTPEDFQPITITAEDGVRLAATRIGRPAAAATLVYVHPLLHERGFWSPVTLRVHEQLRGAVTQITYDQRGHGESDTPDLREATTLRRLADDLDTVLSHACGSVVLIAHSTGAQVVYAYATAHRDRAAALGGLVLLNAAIESPCLPRYLRTWPPRLIRTRRHRWLDVVTAAGEAVLGYRLRRTGPPFMASAGADPRITLDVLAAHRDFGLSETIARYLSPVPSVVLAGERDPFVPAQQARGLADAVWADSVEIVSGAGHDLPHTHTERATDTITSTLDDALRTHLEQPSHPDSLLGTERGEA